MKPRTVRRLCLVDGMNLDHIEGWLESMAARGLHYDHSDASSFTSGGGNRRRFATGWNPVVPWTARRVWSTAAPWDGS